MGDRGRPTRHEGPQFRGTSPLAGLGSPPHLQIPGDVAGDRGALMTLWVYVDTSREVGDADHLKVFANEDVADAWFRDNEPRAWPSHIPSSDTCGRQRHH